MRFGDEEELKMLDGEMEDEMNFEEEGEFEAGEALYRDSRGRIVDSLGNILEEAYEEEEEDEDA